jgi:hypothetical protein
MNQTPREPGGEEAASSIRRLMVPAESSPANMRLAQANTPPPMIPPIK